MMATSDAYIERASIRLRNVDINMQINNMQYLLEHERVRSRFFVVDTKTGCIRQRTTYRPRKTGEITRQ
jgi:hypothetical protein